METIYILDWYVSKYIKLKDVDIENFKLLNPGDVVVYHMDNGETNSLSVGVYTGFPVDTDRT
ncbi:MAG: hypothetical protein GXP45_00395 [bacterium]|nr:hypothetical protein [bacterium]